MATMFKKPKRNFRRKVVSESDSDQENDKKSEDTNGAENGDSMEVDNEPETVSDSQPVKKLKKKKREKDGSDPGKVKPLSFEIEEDADTEVFKVRKSSHSKRIAKQLKRESLKEKKDDEVPEVKKEDVKQTSQEIAEEKLQKLREEIRTLNGDEDDEESDDDGQKQFRSMLKRGEIPDAKVIHMIRKQRQMAREQGDEIPLEESEPVNKTTARLVRDDENDRSDEEEDRIDFTINTAARDRQKMRDDFLAVEHGSDIEGSDEEHQEWEAQQIRKAVTAVGISQVPVGQDVPDQTNYSIFNSTSEKVQTTTFEPFKRLSKTADSSQLTVEAIRKRMQERLHVMDEVYRGHKMERDKLESDIIEAGDTIFDCEKKADGLEERYKFFQEMRGYVRDLVECLNEKVGPYAILREGSRLL